MFFKGFLSPEPVFVGFILRSCHVLIWVMLTASCISRPAINDGGIAPLAVEATHLSVSPFMEFHVVRASLAMFSQRFELSAWSQ